MRFDIPRTHLIPMRLRSQSGPPRTVDTRYGGSSVQDVPCTASALALARRCAAPGSKTLQLLEMLHANSAIPTGVVIANDIDMQVRCSRSKPGRTQSFTLYRLHTPPASPGTHIAGPLCPMRQSSSLRALRSAERHVATRCSAAHTLGGSRPVACVRACFAAAVRRAFAPNEPRALDRVTPSEPRGASIPVAAPPFGGGPAACPRARAPTRLAFRCRCALNDSCAALLCNAMHRSCASTGLSPMFRAGAQRAAPAPCANANVTGRCADACFVRSCSFGCRCLCQRRWLLPLVS